MIKAYLKVLTGLFEGQRFPVIALMTIGRGPDCRIHLNDKQASRHHARIDREGDVFLVRDMNSANGTYLNGEPIEEARLKHDDRLLIGMTEFAFELIDTPPPPNEAAAMVSFLGKEEDRAIKIGEQIKSVGPAAFAMVVPQASAAQQKRLDILMRACVEIAGERNLQALGEKILTFAFQLVPAHRGAILLADRETEALTPVCVRTRSGKGESGPISISSTIVNKVVADRTGLVIGDASLDEFVKTGISIVMQKIRSAMCVPITYQEKVVGVIYMDSTGTVEPFLKEDLAMLNAIAGPAAIAVINARHVATVEEYAAAIERSREQTLAVIANTIEGRDHYTVGHVWRVTHFALALAQEMGWRDTRLNLVRLGGLLHDIGKIAVDDAILHKSSSLTEEEFRKMKIHPEKGASMLKDCEALEPAIPFALYHHEQYNGTGYPFGLAGKEIPEEGRLLAIPDTFDAMTSDRPYRQGLDPEAAIGEIEKNAGTQFDPEFCRAFIAVYRKGKISSIMQDYNKGVTSLPCPFCSTFVRIPEVSTADNHIDCSVCHRHVRLRLQGGSWVGELE
jgi:putative nucleotidyltransferase with HDIG domain